MYLCNLPSLGSHTITPPRVSFCEARDVPILPARNDPPHPLIVTFESSLCPLRPAVLHLQLSFLITAYLPLRCVLKEMFSHS